MKELSKDTYVKGAGAILLGKPMDKPQMVDRNSLFTLQGEQCDEQQFHALFDNSKDLVLLIDPDNGQILDSNPMARLILGYTREEMKTMSLEQLHPQNLAELIWFAENVFTLGSSWTDQLSCRCKDGTVLKLEISGSVFDIRNRKVMIAKMRDTSMIKKIENERDQIQKTLKAKDALFMEVHHRMKNNMQMISSLLGLQARSMDDIDLTEKLNECQQRIKSMVMVHEKLLYVENSSRIDLGDYARDLSNSLFAAYAKGRGNISLQVAFGSVQVSVSEAISCGLIINEILSNSLKYAFPNDLTGIIAIRIASKQDAIQMTIGDDGVGFSDDVDLDQSSTLGLSLIQLLTRQIRGSIEVKKDKGVTYEISFCQVDE